MKKIMARDAAKMGGDEVDDWMVLIMASIIVKGRCLLLRLCVIGLLWFSYVEFPRMYQPNRS